MSACRLHIPANRRASRENNHGEFDGNEGPSDEDANEKGSDQMAESSNDNVPPPKKSNRSFRQRHPRKKAAGNTYYQGRSSSKEQEWDEAASSSDCGFESPKESDDDGMAELIKRTNHVEILSDSDDSSMGGFDYGTENKNPNKRKTKCPQAKKSAGMIKAAFRRNREALTKEAFSEFNQDAFWGNFRLWRSSGPKNWALP
jgi:hypothetical protein